MPQPPARSEKVTDFIITTIVFTVLNYFIIKKTDFTQSLLAAAASALILTFYRQTIKDWIKTGLKKIGLRKG